MLTRLFSISVTVLRNVKRACQSAINKYDGCLAKNQANPMSCIDLLRDVRFRRPQLSLQGELLLMVLCFLVEYMC